MAAVSMVHMVGMPYVVVIVDFKHVVVLFVFHVVVGIFVLWAQRANLERCQQARDTYDNGPALIG